MTGRQTNSYWLYFSQLLANDSLRFVDKEVRRGKEGLKSLS